jgi:hypothetical protein
MCRIAPVLTKPVCLSLQALAQGSLLQAFALVGRPGFLRLDIV